MNIGNQRLLVFLLVLLLLNNFVDASPRHVRRKRMVAGKATKRNFENNFKKSKKNFLENYERSSGVHPLCVYPNFMGIVSNSNYYIDFYKRRCNNHRPPKGGAGPTGSINRRSRSSSARNSRRKKKRAQLNERKQKKLKRLIQKSFCKTMKTMVPIVGPNVDDEFYPCKVVVHRCEGCCLSKLEECVATKKKIRKFDVLRSSPRTNQSLYKAKVEEHVKCECRCKIKESDCGPGQIYEGKNCLCKCPLGSYTTCKQDKRWSERDCKCICKKERDCSTGMFFSSDTCMCEYKEPHLEGFVYEDGSDKT